MTKPLMGRQSFIQGVEVFHQAQRADQSVIFSKSTGGIRRTTLFERASDWLENLLKGDQHKTQWREFNALHARVHLIKQLNNEISMHISHQEAPVQYPNITDEINEASEKIVDELLRPSFKNSEERLATALALNSANKLGETPIEVALRHIKTINKNALSNPVQFEFIKLEVNHQVEQYSLDRLGDKAPIIPVTISSIISTELKPTASKHNLSKVTDLKILQDASHIEKRTGVIPRVALDIAKLMQRDELNLTQQKLLTQDEKYRIAGEVYTKAERYLYRYNSKNKTKDNQTKSLSVAKFIQAELTKQGEKIISQRPKFWGLNDSYKQQTEREIKEENAHRAQMGIQKLSPQDELAIIQMNRKQQNNMQPVVADRVHRRRP
jgi:hypothetical protein